MGSFIQRLLVVLLFVLRFERECEPGGGSTKRGKRRKRESPANSLLRREPATGP